MQVTERLEALRSKKFRNKFFKVGNFDMANLKLKLKEIAIKSRKPKPVLIRQVNVNYKGPIKEIKEKFDASISPSAMAQLRPCSRYSESRNGMEAMKRCFSQSSPLRSQRLYFKPMNSSSKFDNLQKIEKAR